MWSRQLGTGADEKSLHMVVDGLAADDQENIYTFGHTADKLGKEKKGAYDAFFAKYDKTGARQWVRQLGTAEHDVCAGLDMDGSGNLYIAGYTYGAFARRGKGGADMFIAAYDKEGALLRHDRRLAGPQEQRPG